MAMGGQEGISTNKKKPKPLLVLPGKGPGQPTARRWKRLRTIVREQHFHGPKGFAEVLLFSVHSCEREVRRGIGLTRRIAWSHAGRPCMGVLSDTRSVEHLQDFACCAHSHNRNNNNNPIWGGSVFNRRGASTPLW